MSLGTFSFLIFTYRPLMRLDTKSSKKLTPAAGADFGSETSKTQSLPERSLIKVREYRGERGGDG